MLIGTRRLAVETDTRQPLVIVSFFAEAFDENGADSRIAGVPKGPPQVLYVGEPLARRDFTRRGMRHGRLLHEGRLATLGVFPNKDNRNWL